MTNAEIIEVRVTALKLALEESRSGLHRPEGVLKRAQAFEDYLSGRVTTADADADPS